MAPMINLLICRSTLEIAIELKLVKLHTVADLILGEKRRND